jgi:1,4-dihydroxy-2-naphthoate octaprenyltransferase
MSGPKWSHVFFSLGLAYFALLALIVPMPWHKSAWYMFALALVALVLALKYHSEGR